MPQTQILPRDCTFTPSDWQALAPHWYPVAFAHEVTDKPFAARLLDERLVIFRGPDNEPVVARDLCLHRGAPLSLGTVRNGQITCAYHGFRYDHTGACTCIPAHPGAAIPPKLKLQTYPAREQFGLIWTRLRDTGETPFPQMNEWDNSDYVRILPDAVELNAAAGRQIEGFLDVSHFAFIHTATFGETRLQPSGIRRRQSHRRTTMARRPPHQPARRSPHPRRQKLHHLPPMPR